MSKLIWLSIAALGILSFQVHTPGTETLTDKLSRYYNAGHAYSFLLTFNQPYYAPGDTVYFKGYLLDGEGAKLKPGRMVVDLTLSNEKVSSPALFKRVLFKQGININQFVIPKVIESNIYWLTAYLEQPDGLRILYRSAFKIAAQNNIHLVPTIRWKVEQGGFIDGLPSVLLVKGTPQTTCQLHANDSVIWEGSFSDAGEARIIVQPKAGVNYTLSDHNNKTLLKPVLSDGVNILTTDSTIALQVRNESVLRNKELVMLVSDRDKILLNREISFTQPIVKFPFHTTANFRVAIFDKAMNIVTEQLVRKPADDKLQIDVEKVVHHRDSVHATVHVTNTHNQPQGNVVSLSIYRNDLFDIDSYENEFDANSWKEILAHADDKKMPQFPYYFKGKLINTTTKAMVPDSTMVTFYLNANEFIYQLYTKNGQLEFPMFSDFADDEIYYKVSFRGKEIAADFVPSTSRFDGDTVPYETTKELDPLFKYHQSQQAIVESYQYFTRRAINGHRDSELFRQSEGLEIDLRKFETFSSVPEIFSSIVSVVKYRKLKDGDALRVFLKEKAIYANENPVLIIDGLMTNDIDDFLKMNPDNLVRLKILRSESELSRYGSLGLNGIILVETVDNNPSSLKRTKNHFFVNGVDARIDYGIPSKQFHTRKRVPDFRSCLFWMPDLLLTNEQNAFFFRTSDDSAQYVICGIYLDEQGNLCTSKRLFNVGK